MSFAGLPPEIISGLMYAGPGSGPMLAAAAAWDMLAAELGSAAASYESVVSALTSESWLGPSSASMAAAAAPYVAWLTTTSTQAEQVAVQAKAAAGAYETAFAMTVPPPVIAANRAQLMALVATNILGQNTPTIAAIEAQYAEMWAQDAAAMLGYAASSAAVSQFTPFTLPKPATNPAGLTGPATTFAQTTGASAGIGAQTLQGFGSSSQVVPAAVPLQAPGLPGFLEVLGLSPVSSGLSAAGLGTSAGAWGAATNDGAEILRTQDEIALGQREIGDMQREIHMSLFGPSGGSASLDAARGPAPVTAGMGRAAPIGGLSVPSSWTAAAPAIRPVAMALPATTVAAAPAALTGASGTAFSEMALAGMAGRALGGTVSPGGRTVSPGRRERVGVKTRQRAEVPQRSPATPLTGIAAELRELAALRDSGILTDAEFNEQKQRLLGH